MKKHVSTLMALFALVGLTLVGCESPVAPVSDEGTAVAEAVAPALSKNGSPVVGSASGTNAQTFLQSTSGPLRFHTAFHAGLHADGSVSGQGVGYNNDFACPCPPQGWRAHVDFTAVVFDGAMACVVSEVTQSSWPVLFGLPFPLISVGDVLASWVKDNGEGADAPPDEVTSTVIFRQATRVDPQADAEAWCQQPPPAFRPTQRGNIQVRAPSN